MNYEALLKKYIQHVVDAESIDYLSNSWLYVDSFTLEELNELRRLSPCN